MYIACTYLTIRYKRINANFIRRKLLFAFDVILPRPLEKKIAALNRMTIIAILDIRLYLLHISILCKTFIFITYTLKENEQFKINFFTTC